MIYLTRKEQFNAAHKLYNKKWSKEQNEAIFGKCANENWHGHNYTLEVTVKGIPDPETGYVMDAKKLAELIKSEVVDHVDHKNLNLDVPFLADKLPSTENFAIAIWHRLVGVIKVAQLYRIRLFETDKIYVEYFGE